MTALVPRSYGISQQAPIELFNVLDDFFHAPARAHREIFKVDVEEKDDGYVIEADLPGASKENIDIEMNEGKLTIGVKYDEVKDESEPEHNYIHKERRHCSMVRGAYLKDAASEGITAKLENGVLIVEVPKKSPDANTLKVAIA